MNARPLVLLAAMALSAIGCTGWTPTHDAFTPDARMVRVPNDRNAGTIIPRLHRAGLLIAVPDAWRTTSFDGQSVEIMTPKPGTRTPEGTTVAIRVDFGPIGFPAQTTGQHVVPTVIGETLRTATARIDAAKLSWSVDASALPPTSTKDLYAAYCITAQQPLGRTRLTISGSSSIMVKLRARPC